MNYRVCAVLVTHHPGKQISQNVSAIREQVQGLVVVDNGSSTRELADLRNLSETYDFHLIENVENIGVAEALNQGVLWAKRNDFHWVILFDQDSAITENFTHLQFAAWQNHPDRERVASIHPKYVDPKTGMEPRVHRASDGGPIVSLTSGALMPMWIFDKLGGFASDYFVDCVDYEFCLRIRAAGFLISDSREAVLLHSAGEPDRDRKLLGFSFRPTNHSAMRRYYMSRNRIVLYRKYSQKFPEWAMQFMAECLRETIKCFLGEQDRARKFRNFLIGTWDGLRGRMGKREIESASV